MMIYVLNARRVIPFGVAILAVVLVMVLANLRISVWMEDVYSPASKDIPIYSVETPDKKIAITFDCAWEAHDIPEILDILRQYDCRATFFVVGAWAEKNPRSVRMMVENGHEVGSHGYAHLRMGALAESQIRQDISMAHNTIGKITGKSPELLRVPYGDYSSSVLKCARESGYYVIQWNVDSLDWMDSTSEHDMIKRVLSKARNGSIVLFHNDTKYTVKALPKILNNLSHKGFIFVPVSELILRDNYYIDFEGRQRVKSE